MTFLICLSIGAAVARALTNIIYTAELTVRRMYPQIITVGFFYIALKLILSALHFQFSSTTFLIHIAINMVINLITLPLQGLLLPESPHYLYAKGETQQFYLALFQLHKLNFGSDVPLPDIVAFAREEGVEIDDYEAMNIRKTQK